LAEGFALSVIVFDRFHFPGVHLVVPEPIGDVFVFVVAGMIGGVDLAVLDLRDYDAVVDAPVPFKIDADDVSDLQVRRSRAVLRLADFFHVQVEAVGQAPGQGQADRHCRTSSRTNRTGRPVP